MSDPRPDWLDLSDEQIRSDVKALADATLGPTPRGVASTQRVTVREFLALAVQRFFAIAVRPMAQNVDPRIATGVYLRWWGIASGAVHRSARATKGYATITAPAAGMVTRGVIIEAGGQRLAVDADTAIAAATATGVPVTATVVGAAGNVASGAAAEFAGDGPDAPDDATVELRRRWVTVPGHDTDTDDTLRVRVLAALLVRAETNTPARYRLAAYGAPGVSSVATERTPRGYGSADLAVLIRGGVPTQDQLDLVEREIEADGLSCRDLWVRAPEVITVAVEAVLSSSTDTTAAATAIEAWWRAEIGVGDGVPVARLYREAAAGFLVEFRQPLRNLPARASVWYEPSISVRVAA